MKKNESSLRIISLLPSATEIVAELGYIKNIVGRSHECDYPAAANEVPICTSTRIFPERSSKEIHDDMQNLFESAISIFEVNKEKISKLNPTHIITQDQCEECSISIEYLQSALATFLKKEISIVSLNPSRLGDVWADIRKVGEILGPKGKSKADLCTHKITRKIVQIAMKSQAIDIQPKRVAIIEWIDPLIAAGNWVPELVAIAGGENIFTRPGQPSRRITLDEILEKDPDVIIFAPCSFSLEKSYIESHQTITCNSWKNLRAVKTNECFAVDGNAHINRSGPRLFQSIEIISEILNQEMFNFGHNKNSWHRI